MVLGSVMTWVARSGRFWLVVLLAGLLSMVSAGPSAAADGTCTFDTTTGQTTCSFASTGQEQTFTVPADVSDLSVVARGAAGADGGRGGSPGGQGAVVSGTLSVGPTQPVTNGQTLYVEVGGAPTGGVCGPDVNCVGGFNGGGLSREGGGGGGASDVRASPRGDAGTLTTRRLVAAGGGGSGGEQFCASAGGAGGNAEEAGSAGCGGGGSGGQPGTSNMGGAAGSPAGFDGGLGIGGGSDLRVGGGGGGGLYGGGSGGEPTGEFSGAGGGGGGSNLVPAGGTSSLTTDPPQIAITYASLGEQHAALLASVIGVGPGKSLANKARQIQAAADANNKAGACATLAAFIHEVRAQTGKKLTAEQAASLTTQAENIQAMLSC